MAKKKVVKEAEEKPVIPNMEEDHVNEYLNKLIKSGYNASMYEGIITVFVEEITERKVAEINKAMNGYKKSYGILPESRNVTSK